MDEKGFNIRFNQILKEEMRQIGDLSPLPLDPELLHQTSGDDAQRFSLASEYLNCPKTGGVRIGDMDLKGLMHIQFGSIPPAGEYNFPVFGYTFLYANKCLAVVLDLMPVSREEAYINRYIAPLEKISKKYAGIPAVEGGRTENVHEWARQYESGFSIYRWVEKQYLPTMEEAFREYIHVFCDDISRAEPLTDKKSLLQRDTFIKNYSTDYVNNDPGGAPLKSHFGEAWTERYLKEFLFAP